jgi:hypothetical protein
METTFRRMSARQRKEIEGYVAFGPNAFRAVLFLLAVGTVGWLLRGIHTWLVRPAIDMDAVWIVPTLAFAIWLYRYGARWTGGRRRRAEIRRDLARGEVAVHRVVAVDAIELDPVKDEGPSFFIRTVDGLTVLLAGQYLDLYRSKGFPWTIIDIVEMPESKIFLRLEVSGEKLAASSRHPPGAAVELRALAESTRNYRVVDVEFDPLKEGRIVPRRAGDPPLTSR